MLKGNFSVTKLELHRAPMNQSLTDEQRIFFRDRFRDARFTALRDAEGFNAALFALERLGRFLFSREGTLRKYQRHISQVAKFSALGKEIPDEWPDFHTNFDDLYDQIREARNSAFHEGAFARHLTSHAVLISIILEDALMDERDRISDFMVRMPACACMWHPLSFIRQTMLANSFSYLPVNNGTETEPDWRLISDCSLARFLRTCKEADRKNRLAETLQQAVSSGGVSLIQLFICQPNTTLKEVISRCEHHPALVVSSDNHQLLGIATPFDIL